MKQVIFPCEQSGAKPFPCDECTFAQSVKDGFSLSPCASCKYGDPCFISRCYYYEQNGLQEEGKKRAFSDAVAAYGSGSCEHYEERDSAETTAALREDVCCLSCETLREDNRPLEPFRHGYKTGEKKQHTC